MVHTATRPARCIIIKSRIMFRWGMIILSIAQFSDTVCSSGFERHHPVGNSGRCPHTGGGLVLGRPWKAGGSG